MPLSIQNFPHHLISMKYTSFILILLSYSLTAQTISKQVIGTGGANYSNQTTKLSYTAGEVVVGAMTDEEGSVQLGNGYYPSLNLEVLNTTIPSLLLEVELYPNPVSAALYITHPNETLFDIQITDINGKVIRRITHDITQPLSMASYSSGTYIIGISSKTSKQTNTYKIIKQ